MKFTVVKTSMRLTIKAKRTTVIIHSKLNTQQNTQIILILRKHQLTCLRVLQLQTMKSSELVCVSNSVTLQVRYSIFTFYQITYQKNSILRMAKFGLYTIEPKTSLTSNTQSGKFLGLIQEVKQENKPHRGCSVKSSLLRTVLMDTTTSC